MAHRNCFTYYFQFYCNIGIKWIARERGTWGEDQKGPKCRSFFCPHWAGGHHWHMNEFTNPEAPRTLAFRDFVQVSLCNQRFIESLTIGYWAQSPAPSALGWIILRLVLCPEFPCRITLSSLPMTTHLTFLFLCSCFLSRPYIFKYSVLRRNTCP